MTPEKNQARRMKNLIRASHDLARVESLDELFPMLMGLAREVTHAEAASVLQYIPEEDILEFKLADNENIPGATAILKERVTLGLGEGIAGWVAQNRQSVNIGDVRSDQRFYKRADEDTGFVTQAILCSPVVHEAELLGVLQVLNPKYGTRFDEEDQLILEAFADLSAVAIVRSRLLETRVAQERLLAKKNAAAIVESAADAIITYDPETLGITSVNPGAAAIFGHTEEDLCTMPLSRLFDKPEDMEKARANGLDIGEEITGVRKDDSLFPMECVITRSAPGSLEFFIGTFRDVTKKNETIRKLNEELGRAADYVTRILPKPIKQGPVTTDWRFIPSISLGGDAFGYHWLDDTRFVMYLVDISGHGVAAALLAVSVTNVLASQGLAGADYSQPESVLRALNRAFPMERQNRMYFTIWYGVYDIRSRTLSYASGGHPAAMLFPANTTGEPTLLKTPNIFIGGMPDADFTQDRITLPGPSRLFVFSDGVYEIPKSDGRMWRFNDFKTFMTREGITSPSPMDHLLSHARAMNSDGQLEDDFSIMELGLG